MQAVPLSIDLFILPQGRMVIMFVYYQVEKFSSLQDRKVKTLDNTGKNIQRYYTPKTSNKRFIIQLLQSINKSVKEGECDSFSWVRRTVRQTGFLL